MMRLSSPNLFHSKRRPKAFGEWRKPMVVAPSPSEILSSMKGSYYVARPHTSPMVDKDDCSKRKIRQIKKAAKVLELRLSELQSEMNDDAMPTNQEEDVSAEQEEVPEGVTPAASSGKATYALGQVGRPEEIDVPSSFEDSLIKAARLRVGDGAWVKRSRMGDVWTYAHLAERVEGPDGYLTFVVDARGSTKQLKVNHWSKCVRLVSIEKREYDQDTSSGGTEHQVMKQLHIRGQDSTESDTESTTDSSSGGSNKVVLCDYEVSMYTLGGACDDPYLIRVLQDEQLPVYVRPAVNEGQLNRQASDRSINTFVSALSKLGGENKEMSGALDESDRTQTSTERRHSSSLRREPSPNWRRAAAIIRCGDSDSSPARPQRDLSPMSSRAAAIDGERVAAPALWRSRPGLRRRVSWKPDVAVVKEEPSDGTKVPRVKKTVNAKHLRSVSLPLTEDQDSSTMSRPMPPADRRSTWSGEMKHTEESLKRNKARAPKRPGRSIYRQKARRSMSVMCLPAEHAFWSVPGSPESSCRDEPNAMPEFRSSVPSKWVCERFQPGNDS